MTVWSLTPCRDCGIPTSGSVAPGGIVHMDLCPACASVVHRCAECRLALVPAAGRLCDDCLGYGLGRAVRAATLGQALVVMAVLVGFMLALGALL